MKLRIAVADDEPDMRDYLRRILPLLGHEVVAVASDGAELVLQCEQTKPDLVITDIKMPVMDGWTALARICATRPVPAVVISGHSRGQAESVRPGRPLEAYLVKPIKRIHLQAAIHRALEHFHGSSA